MTKPVANNPVLVRARGLSKVFDVSGPWMERMLSKAAARKLVAVDAVDLEIRRGETLALVGESGCGKSTIARLLVGLHAPSGGEITFDGAPLVLSGSAEGSSHGTAEGSTHGSGQGPGQLREQRRRIQMIFQDPYASLNPRWRIERIIAEPLRVHRLLTAPRAIADRVRDLLQQVGLSAADALKFPHQFSGGQRQRISIARALASQPEFLVCDEPTSALDVSVQAQVLNLMRDLQQSRGLTYLLISHNLAVVHHAADRVAVMYLGRIVELAPKTPLFAAPRHPYTQMLLRAIPDPHAPPGVQPAPAGEVPDPLAPPQGCAFHPRCPIAQARCRLERPALTELPGTNHWVACHEAQAVADNAQSSASP